MNCKLGITPLNTNKYICIIKFFIITHICCEFLNHKLAVKFKYSYTFGDAKNDGLDIKSKQRRIIDVSVCSLA